MRRLILRKWQANQVSGATKHGVIGDVTQNITSVAFDGYYGLYGLKCFNGQIGSKIHIPDPKFSDR